MIVDVRMGESGIPGNSIIVVGELTDGVALMSGGGKWLVSSDIVRGVGVKKIRFPSISNLTLGGESIVDKCDNWDGDIGASSGPSTFVRLFILLTLRLIRRT